MSENDARAAFEIGQLLEQLTAARDALAEKERELSTTVKGFQDLIEQAESALAAEREKITDLKEELEEQLEGRASEMRLANKCGERAVKAEAERDRMREALEYCSRHHCDGYDMGPDAIKPENRNPPCPACAALSLQPASGDKGEK